MLRQLSLALLAMASAAVAAPTPHCPDYCKGIRFRDAQYICGDSRLGPVQLPTLIPINVTTIGYHPFGGMCPGSFLFTWYKDTANSSTSGYAYPPLEGFIATTDGKPLTGEVILDPGTLVDRFGSEHGNFLAPYSTPYEQRSIPPSNLATSPSNPVFPNNYHVYEVRKPLTVLAGPIAPWFGQPGLGTQFKTLNHTKVRDLLNEGILRSVNPDELVDGEGRVL